MNKTIYIRDEDVPVWDKARELAGDKLAPVIMDGLKRYVADKEAAVTGFERIVVQYRDSSDLNIPKAKSFYGRWIFPPDEPFLPYKDNLRFNEFTRRHSFAVAITSKGSAVIYSWHGTEIGNNIAECFDVFNSLPHAATVVNFNLAAQAAIEKLGIPVEELDI